MNNLKISIFSMLLMLTISVFLTSCEEEILDVKTEQISDADYKIEFNGALLKDFQENHTKEEVQEYFEDATKEELNQLNLEYLTVKFLEEKGKLNESCIQLIKEGSFSETELTEILSTDELRELDNIKEKNTIESPELNSRCCVDYCYPVYGFCGIFPCLKYYICWTECS